MNPFSLSGKTLLVTGASSGIGKATAIECSKLGANLIITGRNETRLQETLSLLTIGTHKALIGDLTNAEDIDALVSDIETLDGLVMCAGKGLLLPVQFSSRDKFLDIFDSNFLSPIELIRQLVKKKSSEKALQ